MATDEAVTPFLVTTARVAIAVFVGSVEDDDQWGSTRRFDPGVHVLRGPAGNRSPAL
jgi:hypothetical protein